MELGRFNTNSIYCEDSYKAIKDLPNNSIDCIYTDIPYLYVTGGGGNSALGERTLKKRKELSDISDGIDYDILNDFVRVLKKINCFIWCSKMQIYDILKFFNELPNKTITFEILTWNKTNPTPSTNNVWLPDIEYCLYFREKGVYLNGDYFLKSKWYTSSANKTDKDYFEHPTIKPIELVKRHLLHATQPNDIVVDFFMGSGTTCVACEDIKRQYIGFEIEPKWFKVAQSRLAKTTANGQTSFLLI